MLSFAFAVLFFANADKSISPQNFSRINCWESRCLEQGWTRQGTSSNDYLDVKCRDQSCHKNGWYVGNLQGWQTYTTCKDRGCFTDGWWSTPAYSTVFTHQSFCDGPSHEEQDCFKYGWTTYTKSYSYRVLCLNQDCRRWGWHFVHPEKGYKKVTCLSEDCFKNGWEETKSQMEF